MPNLLGDGWLNECAPSRGDRTRPCVVEGTGPGPTLPQGTPPTGPRNNAAIVTYGFALGKAML